MGIVIPSNKSVLAFEGLHLYHSGVSNCSMRVRMTLVEKGLDWTSHHLNILQKEHLTAEYFGINPNGLVPTLVHDGVVIIESDDIIEYLDDQFPEPSLKPVDEADRNRMLGWLHRATGIHLSAVKPYIYYKRVGKQMAHSAGVDQEYRKLQKNPDLLAFHAKSTQEGFSDEDIRQAVDILEQCFQDMDAALLENEWLVDGHFSLADIAWIPLYYTLREMAGYDFGGWRQVSDWADRISSRASYQSGILDWWPEEMKRN